MLTLKQWRLRRFLTQAELASKSRVCRDTVNQVERRKQKPAIRTMRNLARALEVKPSEIRFSKK